MRATFILPAMMLALVSCGSEPTAEKSADEVIAEAAGIDGPIPGQYQTKTMLREFSIPGVPAEQVAMMKRQFAANSDRTDTFCMTKDQAENGFKDMVRQMSEMGEGVECAFSKFDASGSKLDAALSCTGPGGTKMSMGMNGTVQPEQSDMTMTMTSSSSMMPGMEMTMVMDSESKRIGDCPAEAG